MPRFLAKRIFSSLRSFAGWCATSISRSRSSPARPSAKRTASPLSSRNQYLNAEERAQAPIIRAALAGGGAVARKHPLRKILAAVRQKIESAPLARIDYAEIVGADDLQPRLTIEPRSLLAVAVFFGKTRLIDNILLG